MSRLEVWKHEPADKPGFVRFKEMCTVEELLGRLENYLKSQWSFSTDDHTIVYNLLDYLHIDHTFDKTFDDSFDDRIPYARWIIGWMVMGGNEGYYFHIEAVKNQAFVHIPLIIGKTLCGKNQAYEIQYWINRFLNEEIE